MRTIFPFASICCAAFVALAALADAVTAEADSDDPTFDHQSKTYVTTHNAPTASGSGLRLTPFFSPEQSSSTLAALVQEAKVSVDIGCKFPFCLCAPLILLQELTYLVSTAPGFSSWSGCSTSSLYLVG